jgi:DNA-binding response OmpR family regulator
MALVLVCDDNDLMLRTIEYRLRTEGNEVLTAPNGHTAEDILRRRGQQINLVITDLLLPYMSGLELINLVRNHYHLKVPIIVLTKINNEAIRQPALEMGADEYLAKPFDPDNLSLEVRKLLTNRRL